jgi:hypothetical protein
MTKRSAFVTCVASLVALVLLFVLEDRWHPPSELLLPTSELKTTVSVLLLGSSKNDSSDRGNNVTIRTRSHDKNNNNNNNNNTTVPTTTTSTTTTRPKHLEPQQEPFCRWTYPTQDDTTLKSQEIVNSSCFQWLNQVHYHPQPPANVRDGPTTTTTAPPSSSSEKSHGNKNNKNLRYWYFMGDSTMGQMFTQLVGLFHPTKKLVFGGGNTTYYTATTLKESRAHCDVVSDYYKLPRGPISNWTYPNHAIFEGPNWGTIGPGTEYCMDCQGCYHHQVRLTASKVTTTRKRRQRTTTTTRRVSTSNNENENTDDDAFFLENLVVEFPLDVESPTITTRTTQETVILYIEQQQEQRRQERQQERKKEQAEKKKSRNMELDMENDTVISDIDDIDDDDDDDTTTATVCVVNTGIHSQIFRSMPAEPYVEQTLDFLSLLQSTVCGTIIWVTTSATMDVERYAQKNWRLEEWNAKLEHAIVTQQPPLRNYLPSSTTMTTTTTTTINRTQPTRTKNDDEEGKNPLHVWGLDVWNVTLVRPHNDNIHMTRDYYATLGNVFAQLITSGGGGE